MGKKIKDSLAAKVFLWIFGILAVCSMLIYGCVMVFIPQRYGAMSRARAIDDVIRLSEELSQTPFDTIGTAASRFCLENQLVVEFRSGADTFIYGIPEGRDIQWEEDFSFTTSITANDTGEELYLRLLAWASPEEALTSAFMKLLPLILVLILFISTLGALLCSRVLVKPVIALSRVSRRMAELDLGWNYRIERTDEIGVLARSLETMSQKLGEALRELEAANAQLRRDVEHMSMLSAQRRDFFAAASHELKTPITILKGQIESMILGIGSFKDTRRVLPGTLKEVENMERLVKEILTISRLEMDGLAGRSETVSVSSSLEKVAKLLQPLAEEKNITMEKSIAPGITLQGNPSLLEKAFHNVLSNAIRHSPGRAKVTLTLQEGLLEVRNTGVTIPEDDIGTLFAPFYRVDKSRNKSTGGSGLGLYLVKTILELHGLAYQLGNFRDGVFFRINLNQK